MLVCIDCKEFPRTKQVFNQKLIQEENAVCLMIHIIVGCKNFLSVIKKINDQSPTFRKRKVMLYYELIKKGQHFLCSPKNFWITEVSICENVLKKGQEYIYMNCSACLFLVLEVSCTFGMDVLSPFGWWGRSSTNDEYVGIVTMWNRTENNLSASEVC